MNPEATTTPSLDLPTGKPAEDTYSEAARGIAGHAPIVSGPTADENNRRFAALEAEILAQHAPAIPVNFAKKGE